MCRESGLRLRTAPLELCTDNALMIAFAASQRTAQSISGDLDIHPNFDPSLVASAGTLNFPKDEGE